MDNVTRVVIGFKQKVTTIKFALFNCNKNVLKVRLEKNFKGDETRGNFNSTSDGMLFLNKVD